VVSMLLDIDLDSIASRVQWLLIPRPVACIPCSTYILGPLVMVPFDPAPHARACLRALDALEVFRRAFLSYATTSLAGYLSNRSSSGSSSPSAEEQVQEYTEPGIYVQQSIAPERPTFRPNTYTLSATPIAASCLVCNRSLGAGARCFALDRSCEDQACFPPAYLCFQCHSKRGAKASRLGVSLAPRVALERGTGKR
jgi:hypothetical protein